MSRMKDVMKDRVLAAFTLVELMVAVSILAIGMVFVLRSFLTTSGALDTCVNRIAAIQILESKMDKLEEETMLQQGLSLASETTEDVYIGERKASYKSEIKPLSADGMDQETQNMVPDLEEAVNVVTLSLLWKEGNTDKDEILAAYFNNKKETK